MVISFIQQFLGRGKNTITCVTADSLRSERIALQNEERKLGKDLGRLSEERERLVQEYSVARDLGDEQQKKCVARRFEEIKDQQKALDSSHAFLTKRMRVLNGILRIKEKEAFLKRVGSSVLNLDLIELQAFVERATDDGELTDERLDTLLETMGDAADRASSVEDAGLVSVVSELDTLADARVGSHSKAGVSGGSLDAAIAGIDRELTSRGTTTRNAAKETQ